MATSSSSSSLQPVAFISHAGTDSPTAGWLKDLLEPWATARLDFNSIPPGAAWRDSLKALSCTSKVFIALVSNDYLKRRWCMLELRECLRARAAGADIALIPLLLDVNQKHLSEPPKDWRAAWRQLQRAKSAHKDAQVTVQQLQQACRQLASIQAVLHFHCRKGDLKPQLTELVPGSCEAHAFQKVLELR